MSKFKKVFIKISFCFFLFSNEVYSSDPITDFYKTCSDKKPETQCIMVLKNPEGELWYNGQNPPTKSFQRVYGILEYIMENNGYKEWHRPLGGDAIWTKEKEREVQDLIFLTFSGHTGDSLPNPNFFRIKIKIKNKNKEAVLMSWRYVALTLQSSRKQQPSLYILDDETPILNKISRDGLQSIIRVNVCYDLNNYTHYYNAVYNNEEEKNKTIDFITSLKTSGTKEILSNPQEVTKKSKCQIF